MIEEIDSAQYVQHYFEKAYRELECSPEMFLRHALEFVQKEAGLLTQPGALDSLRRLAERIAITNDAAAAQETDPMSVQLPSPAGDVQIAAKGPETDSDARQSTPSFTVDANTAEGVKEDVTSTAALVGNTITPNEGNGADLSLYSWTQTLSEVSITIPVPKGTKGSMCSISISRSALKAGLKNAPAFLDGLLYAPVVVDECLWNISDGSLIEITLQKADTMQWWKSVVVGEPEIDTQQVEPESSKLSDLAPDMRATVEKMMYDQRQKAMGLPTSDEAKKAEIMKNFMDAHPEMDFSQAKFTM